MIRNETNIALAFITGCFLLYGILADYLGIFYQAIVFIVFIIDIFRLIQIQTNRRILVVLILLIILFFVFVSYPKCNKNIQEAEFSNTQFLLIPTMDIKEIRILARLNFEGPGVKFKITNRDIIREIQQSLQKVTAGGDGFQKRDYYAISFIDRNNDFYSISIYANSYGKDQERAIYQNTVLIRKNFNYDVFKTLPTIVSSDRRYKCDALIPVINKYIDTLIIEKPDQLYHEIN